MHVYRRTSCIIAACVIALPAIVVPTCVAAATTAPAINAKQVRALIQRLASIEPQDRADARRELMGLAPGDLPTLREAMAAAPLNAAEAEPLEDIVTFVLTRQNILDATTSSAFAFMGVSLAQQNADTFEFNKDGPLVPPEGVTQRALTGVVVVSRISGFVAYRFLEDGDVIESLTVRDVTVTPSTVEQLIELVANARPGELITLEIMRGARSLTVRFPLDSRRNVVGLEKRADDAGVNVDNVPERIAFNSMIEAARQRATEQWVLVFQSLLEPPRS